MKKFLLITLFLLLILMSCLQKIVATNYDKKFFYSKIYKYDIKGNEITNYDLFSHNINNPTLLF